MHLPSFLWLWRIAAWSMGFAIAAYLTQVGLGLWMVVLRHQHRPRPRWVRPLHLATGGAMVFLVLLLLAIGIVGTLGHYGSLGHSPHLWAGVATVHLALLSAWSAAQISPETPWARPFHISINVALGVLFVAVSLTGWSVVQKYLTATNSLK